LRYQLFFNVKMKIFMPWSQCKRQLAGKLLAAATGALLPGAAACARTGSDGLVRAGARARISAGSGAPLGGSQAANGSTPDKPRDGLAHEVP